MAAEGLLLLVGGAWLAGTVGWAWARARSARPAWRAAGQALGLNDIQLRGRTWFMAGEVDGWAVQVRVLGQGDKQTTHLVVRPGTQGRLSAQVAFAAEPKALSRLLAAADRTLGEPIFDGAVRIGEGPWPLVLGLLDSTTRNRLMACVADGVAVEGGELVVTAGGPASVAADLEARIRRMVQLAKALDLSEGDLPSRLARNARRDLVAAVRQANLEALLTTFTDAPVTDRAARAALTDREPAIRFAAAVHLGAEARPVMADVVADPKTDAGLRARALLHLLDQAPADWTEALLINHAGPEAPGALRAVVAEHAARRGLAPALLAILMAPAGVPDGPLALAARAAAAVGPLAEPSLLALAQEGSGGARVAAIEALGAVGGPAAAGLLRPLTRGVTLSSEVKAAAQAALEKLSARLATSPGALSLAAEADHVGRLALAAPPEPEK